MQVISQIQKKKKYVKQTDYFRKIRIEQLSGMAIPQ